MSIGLSDTKRRQPKHAHRRARVRQTQGLRRTAVYQEGQQYSSRLCKHEGCTPIMNNPERVVKESRNRRLLRTLR